MTFIPRNASEQEVLRFLACQRNAAPVASIAAGADLSETTVRACLRRMLDEGAVTNRIRSGTASPGTTFWATLDVAAAIERRRDEVAAGHAERRRMMADLGIVDVGQRSDRDVLALALGRIARLEARITELESATAPQESEV